MVDTNTVRDRVNDLASGQESFIAAMRSDDPVEREKATNMLLLRIARCIESVASSLSEFGALANENRRALAALQGGAGQWQAWLHHNGRILVVAATAVLCIAIAFDSPIASALADAIRKWTAGT